MSFKLIDDIFVMHFSCTCCALSADKFMHGVFFIIKYTLCGMLNFHFSECKAHAGGSL